MKKLFVLIAVAIASASAVSAQGWGIGGRVGTGIQVVGQRYFANDNYLEARLGIGYIDGVGADISLLYNWNTFNWNWTPGNWFLDFGAGVNVIPSKHSFYLGVQGVAKFGYEFAHIPLTLAVDWSPSFGPDIALKNYVFANGKKSQFGTTALFHMGLSAIYRF